MNDSAIRLYFDKTEKNTEHNMMNYYVRYNSNTKLRIVNRQVSKNLTIFSIPMVFMYIAHQSHVKVMFRTQCLHFKQLMFGDGESVEG